MSSAAKSVRASKREVIVIDDDESTSEQPVMKSVKREEEPVPSSEVVELQQKVIKLEDTVQRACRAARTAELRAEAAEIRLDAKYGIKDGFLGEKERADELEKRVNDLSILLATERQQAIDNQTRDRARIEELTQKLSHYEDGQQLLHNLMQSHPPPAPPAQLQLLLPPPPPPPVEQLLQQQQKQHTADLERRVKDLSKLLATEQQQAIDNRSRDRARLEEISMKLEVEKSKVSELTHQNVELNVSLAIRNESDLQKSYSRSNRKIAAAAPLEPTTSPGWCNFSSSSSAPSTSVPAAAAANAAPPFNNRHVRHQTGHPTNIFQLCHPGSGDAMMLNKARVVLTAAYQKDCELIKSHGTYSHSWNLECEMCQRFFTSNVVVPHFLSKKHQSNVTAANAAVSRHAVAYWVGRLTNVAQRSKRQSFARPMHLPPAAAAAATQPMQPVSTAVAATTRPVKPVPAAVAAITRPMQPVAAAVAATTRPMQPVAVAVVATTRQMQHVAVSVPAISRPKQPVAAAVAATTRPMQPVDAAVAATTRPIQPVAAAVAATTRPTQPVAAAVAATTRPMQPVSTSSAARPMQLPPAAAAPATLPMQPVPAAESTFTAVNTFKGVVKKEEVDG